MAWCGIRAMSSRIRSCGKTASSFRSRALGESDVDDQQPHAGARHRQGACEARPRAWRTQRTGSPGTRFRRQANRRIECERRHRQGKRARRVVREALSNFLVRPVIAQNDLRSGEDKGKRQKKMAAKATSNSTRATKDNTDPGCLFVLDLSENRVLSMRSDGSNQKVIISESDRAPSRSWRRSGTRFCLGFLSC